MPDFISLDALIAAKSAMNRDRDRLAADQLRAIKSIRENPPADRRQSGDPTKPALEPLAKPGAFKGHSSQENRRTPPMRSRSDRRRP